MSDRTRVAILAHSVNPRGGVVHALELGDALTRMGHEATVFAPDAAGRAFFRDTLCRTRCIAAKITRGGVREMVEARIADYLRHFERSESRCFEIWHAQDGISGNALATLKERGLISAFARTVHHVDAFEDERVNVLQRRSIETADHLFVVGHAWRDWLGRELGREATYVGNGVDRSCYSPVPDATDRELRERLALPEDAPVFLAVGGVEERKNTVRTLQAFQAVRLRYPSCLLLIAGGASILDHGAYQANFAGALADSGAADAVIRTGPMQQRLMPALYRAATALVFPSLREGFGLVVLEAMASGVPVVTSRIAPFTEYLGVDDALWCNPLDPPSIAAAMVGALDPSHRERVIGRGLQVALRHDWADTARAHLPAYEKLRGADRCLKCAS
jgi:glycosyltransferase-like protein